MMVLDLNYTIRVTVEDSNDLLENVLTPISDTIKSVGGHIKESGFIKVNEESKVVSFKGE